jgi:hypothetical protein
MKRISSPIGETALCACNVMIKQATPATKAYHHLPQQCIVSTWLKATNILLGKGWFIVESCNDILSVMMVQAGSHVPASLSRPPLTFLQNPDSIHHFLPQVPLLPSYQFEFATSLDILSINDVKKVQKINT